MTIRHLVRTKKTAGWTGEVPARSHKPNDVGSNPAPATKLLDMSRRLYNHMSMVNFMGIKSKVKNVQKKKKKTSRVHGK